MMLTVDQLQQLLAQATAAGHGRLPVTAQGFNESGDLVDLKLRGDIRLDHDAVGNLFLIIR